MVPERFEKKKSVSSSVSCNISYGIRDFVGRLFTHVRSYVRHLDIKSAEQIAEKAVGPRRAACRRENFVRCLMTIDTSLSSCQSYRYHSVGDSMEGRGRQPRQTLLWCSYQAIQPSIQPARTNFLTLEFESKRALAPSWRYGDLLRESIYNFPYTSPCTRGIVQ